jgi:hypothetical protein
MKRADIHSNTVVDVWVPAEGLLLKRLPPNEDVVWRFAFENGFSSSRFRC